MFLYDYVFYVLYRLVGGFSNMSYDSYLVFTPILPRHVGSYAGVTISNNALTLDRFFQSVDFSNGLWNIIGNPVFLASWLVYFLCIIITVEICLILPFRAFKRLVRYPNRNLMTPGEYRRSKRR